MKSEKVKEIKARLQEAIEYCARELEKDLFQKSLTLINELESERSEVEIKNNIRLALLNIALLDEKKQLKDRIAELEKENSEQLKQFAERLKEKMGVREYLGVKYKQGVFSENDIDETLMEFIKE